jgi:hypothetical protein
MSLIHDWTEEGATPEERALVAASKNERPSASARTKTLAALGLGTVITATTVTATTTAAATTSSGIALGTLGKIVAVVLVVGGASGGFVAWHASGRSKNVVVVPAAERAPVEPPAAVATRAAAPEKVDESMPPSRGASAPAVRPRAAAASPSANTLSLEVAALEKAHRAIAAHDSAAALRALDRYHAQFPNGTLASEETVLRVQAALAQGDKSNAAALAKEFRATHPDSPYGKRVEDLVSNKATKP